ncbi:VanW family protein [Cellulomonas persica]|uniref:Peptidoglycan binding domain-containing protein n=1 Tax=Cellulomonas persica TaxID=76861 RepID=A0A510UTL6_9CELL|nr:VanW family protein [Cellulomonas persica]GEK18007.1 hypothetical protein CPE01_17400 [Cellulomonas persica]
MTDRTDVDSPSQDEPSKPGDGDEIVWPVWGAGDRRPALSEDTHQIPVVQDEEPPSDEADEPASDQAEVESAAVEPAAVESAAVESASDEATSDEASLDEPATASDEGATDESASDGSAPEEPASDETPAGERSAEDAATAQVAADEVATGAISADEAPAEESAAGEPDEDEPIAGEPAESASDTAPGEVAIDETATDESVTGQVVTDEAVAGEAATDETAADETAAEGAASDEAAADVPVSDGPVAAEAVAAEAVAPGPLDDAVNDAATGDAAADADAPVQEATPGEVAGDDDAADQDGAQALNAAGDAEAAPADEVTSESSTEAAQESTPEAHAEEPALEHAPSGGARGASEHYPDGDPTAADETAVLRAAPDETVIFRPEADATVRAAADGTSTADEKAARPAAADETVVVPTPAAETVVLAPVTDDRPDAAAAAPGAGAASAASAPTRESVLPGRAERTSAPAEARGAAPTQEPLTPPVPPALAGTARISAGSVPQQPREASPFDEFEPEERTRRWPRRVLIGAGTLVVLGGAYVGASYATADRVPRGTTVAGVDIGGLSSDAAVARLDDELAATTGTAVAVQANDVQATIEPAEAGLSFDAQATVDGLTGVDLADPLRLWHQITGLGESEPVTQVDEDKLDAALEALGESLSLAPVDGAVLFVDGGAVLTDATEGWALDDEAAAEVVERDWLVAAQPLVLPTEVVEPAITQEVAQAALDDVAEPLVSAPISVTVSEKLAVLQPATLAAAASMQPEDGELVLQLDGELLAEEVVDQLPEGVLTSASDAHFEFQDDKPVLVPGEPGTTVAPEDVAAAVAEVANAQNRTAVVELSQTDPAETTEAMEKLGIKEIVSEFSTPLTSEPRRTKNIAQGLSNITGVLVRPGETFSLTEALGPIDAAHGFVQAGAIVNGEHSDAWGGGLSQVSTTTFNAAYLAGMEDVEHTPHSEWFSRYPEGREATLFTGQIDMKWKNTTPYGALVQGWVSGGRAYVRIWGTKHFTVESTTSGRSGVVQPRTVYSDSRTCTPQSAGNPGFSVTVTRKLLLDGELLETTSKTWRYKPQNRVVCGEPPSQDDEEKDG